MTDYRTLVKVSTGTATTVFEFQVAKTGILYGFRIFTVIAAHVADKKFVWKGFWRGEVQDLVKARSAGYALLKTTQPPFGGNGYEVFFPCVETYVRYGQRFDAAIVLSANVDTSDKEFYVEPQIYTFSPSMPKNIPQTVR